MSFLSTSNSKLIGSYENNVEVTVNPVALVSGWLKLQYLPEILKISVNYVWGKFSNCWWVLYCWTLIRKSRIVIFCICKILIWSRELFRRILESLICVYMYIIGFQCQYRPRSSCLYLNIVCSCVMVKFVGNHLRLNIIMKTLHIFPLKDN